MGVNQGSGLQEQIASGRMRQMRRAEERAELKLATSKSREWVETIRGGSAESAFAN